MPPEQTIIALTALLAGLLLVGVMLAGRRVPGESGESRLTEAGSRSFAAQTGGGRIRGIRGNPWRRFDASRGVVADDHDRPARRRHQRLVRRRPGPDLPPRRRRGRHRGDLPRAARVGGYLAPAALGRGRGGRCPHRRPVGVDRLRIVAVRDAVRPGIGRGRPRLRPASRSHRRGAGHRRLRRHPRHRSSAGGIRAGGRVASLDRTRCDLAAGLRRRRVRRSPASRDGPRHRAGPHRPADLPVQPRTDVRHARAGGQSHQAQRSRLLRSHDRP